MPIERYKTLAEFRTQIEQFTHDDYVTRPFAPFSELIAASMVEVPYYSHTHFPQFAKVLEECAAAQHVDAAYVKQRLQEIHRDLVLGNDLSNKICNLIEDVMMDEQHADSITVLPLICGAGKSTAISHLIRRVLEAPDHDGVLIVTDRKDRMEEYISPSPDFEPELHAYLTANNKRITILHDGKDLPKELAAARKSPVLIMTTQRYFMMDKENICDLLHWGRRHHRSMILFDEAPVMTEHISVDRKTLNYIATLLSEQIRFSRETQEEKQFCIRHWEILRNTLYTTICSHEDLHEIDEYITPYEFPRTELTDDDERFLRFINEHRGELRIGKTDYAMLIYQLFRLIKTPCICYAGRGGLWYNNTISAVVDNRDKLRDLDAKVIILDGTGEIHPDYNPDVDNIRNSSKYSRSMENLTIHFVNTAGISKSNLEEGAWASYIAAAAAKYIHHQLPDEPVAAFTYQDAKASFADHFAAMEHFGNIKGKNTFRDFKCIAQIGVHRYPAAYYAAQTLYHHPEMLTVTVNSSPDELLAWSGSVLNSEELQRIRDHFLLVDIEQNLFRSKIRMPDCIVPVHYYVFCSTLAYKSLIDLTRERFTRPDCEAKIVVEDDAQVMKDLINDERPEDELSHEEILRRWIGNLPPGTVFTSKEKSAVDMNALLMLDETGISKDQYDKVKENSPAFKAFMARMHYQRRGYFIKLS